MTDKEILDFVRDNLIIGKDENGHYILKEVNCPIYGYVWGDVHKDIIGKVRSIWGSVAGDVVGDVGGSVFGDVRVNVRGKVRGKVLGGVGVRDVNNV